VKKRKDVPRGAVAPKQIRLDELWDLDVDSDIWQDVGLNDVAERNVRTLYGKRTHTTQGGGEKGVI